MTLVSGPGLPAVNPTVVAIGLFKKSPLSGEHLDMGL